MKEEKRIIIIQLSIDLNVAVVVKLYSANLKPGLDEGDDCGTSVVT